MPKMPSFVPTQGTTEVLTFGFCFRCQRQTMRQVFEGGIEGPCMGCNPDCMTKAQQLEAKRRESEQRQPRLF